jgi:hypothetical protein
MMGVVLGIAFAAGLAGGGCGDDDPVEEVDQLADCTELCSRYSECVAEIDVTACTDTCEDLIELSPSVGKEADICEDCLDDRSCAEIEAGGCFDSCPVIPLQD